MADMRDWNVVVSVRGECYQWARKHLREYARVDRTDFYNILALRVEDMAVFLVELRQATEADPKLRDCLARVMPAQHSFIFQTPEDFEARATQAVNNFLPQLAGKAFYVRMHRRGFRGVLASQREERLLARHVLETLQAAGTPGTVRFTDPDVVITLETIGQWAGMALWTREDLARYPFVQPE